MGRTLSLCLAWLALSCGLLAEPIGIKNHNPGNVIAFNWKKWPGAVGVDPWGHLKFKDDLHGLRAIKKVLRTYDKKHDIKTAYQIVSRYINKKATPKIRMDYAKTLCQFTKKNPHEVLDMKDPHILYLLGKGIVRHECGQDPYSEKLYERVFFREP